MCPAPSDSNITVPGRGPTPRLEVTTVSFPSLQHSPFQGLPTQTPKGSQGSPCLLREGLTLIFQKPTQCQVTHPGDLHTMPPTF